MKKKIAAVLTAITVFACGIPLTAQTLHAASGAFSYNSYKAISYAKKNVYVDAYKIDCINFARACINAGGLSSSSYSIPNFINYMKNEHYASYSVLKVTEMYGMYFIDAGKNAGKISPGDMIVYYCPKCDKKWHAAVCAYADRSGSYAGCYRCYAHNGPWNNVVLQKNRHKSCGTPASQTRLYCLHMRSVENGFRTVTSEYDPKTDTNCPTKLVRSEASTPYRIKAKGSTLRYRSGPGTSFRSGGAITSAYTYSITATSNGWGKLKKNGAWVNLKYADIVTTCKAKISSGSRSLRKGPGSYYSVAGKAGAGEYTVTAISGKWCRLKEYNLWVCTDYLTLI